MLRATLAVLAPSLSRHRGHRVGSRDDLAQFNPPMRNNYTSIFLRQTFELTNPAAVNQFEALVDYDDGLVAWINGVEVLRLNVDGLDGDPVAVDELTPSGHESGLFEGYPLPDPAGYLVEGTNIVAVQVFNTSLTSSDLKLDLEIFDPFAPDLSPPSVDMVVPSPGVTVRRLASIQVTFDEEVTGVDATDLLIDGLPTTSVSGSARGPYMFSFPQPAVGSVPVRWSGAHGITDQASPPNPFSGGSWVYDLDPDAPPGNLVINELLAVNGNDLRDQDGDASDWFEILNAGTESVDVGGWSVTDDPDFPGKWVFPGRVLAPQRFLVIFASGKDRRPGNGELHANFRLSSRGEFLALFNNESPRELISVFAPRYPRQRSDYSYGLDGTGDLVYFSSPSPGAPNTGGAAFDGFVLEPRLTPERGIYDESFSATITSVTPGTTVRYTLDGSEPSPTRGTVYTGPISVEGTPTRAVRIIRAIAYAGGLLPSQVVSHSYIFTEDVRLQPANPSGFPTSWNGQPADYAMDARVVNDPAHRELVRQGLVSIPTVSIAMNVNGLFGGATGFYANPSRSGIAWERPCSAELIYPDGRRGFQIDCGIRAQGGSSVNGWKVIKISMRLAFRGDYGPTKLRYPLFPDSPVKEFNTLILDAHMNQTWQHPSHGQRVRGDYIRDVFMSDVQNAMGGFAPHDVYVNLYLNGLYWGVFDIHERADGDFGASYFGGVADEYDAMKHSGSRVEDGNASAWNAMMSVANRNLSSSANYLELQDHIDMPRFADYMIMNHFGGNDDWDHHNWYATRRRTPDGLWRFHSWDAEHSLKSVNLDNTGKNNSGKPTGILTGLRSNADFRLLFADRVHRHFFDDGVCYVDPSNPTWNEESPHLNRPADLFMKRVQEIDTAIACEAARWGDTRRSNDPYTRNDEWQTEINGLIRQYFRVRSRNVLQHFENRGLYPSVGAPVFNRLGGRVPPGFGLTMTRPVGTSGTIYYTTDGADPRVFGSGAVSGSARSYASPLTIDDFTLVKARIRNDSTWSALNESTYAIGASGEGLRISEIMYNPLTSSAFEFVELINTDSQTAGLGGLRFTQGITFAFASDQLLAPGERLVLVSDATAFASRYRGVEIGGVFLGTLVNGGERITLETTEGRLITSTEYDDDRFWPRSPDGLGFSLVLSDFDQNESFYLFFIICF